MGGWVAWGVYVVGGWLEKLEIKPTQPTKVELGNNTELSFLRVGVKTKIDSKIKS